MAKSRSRNKRRPARNQRTFDIQEWSPKTALGKAVKQGHITDIREVIESGKVILEAEIVDALIPNVHSDLLLVGQAKGKFGGGQRRVFRQTQKKTREGNKPSFSTYAVVGNGNGYVGLGYGKAKETVPAREKAIRNAKINLIQVARGSGDWESDTTVPHTIPFAVTGKCGSVEVTLMPAPLGTGLVIESECQKILKAAGIKDIRSKAKGLTGTKTNMIKACFDALRKLVLTKVREGDIERLSIVWKDRECARGLCGASRS
ncbi:MAG: 30S ribosomal protein S5 [Nanoarchaeota archaeon]